jgi:hypothetical protein
MPEFDEGQLPEPLTTKEIFQLIWTDPVRVFTVLRHYHINQWTYGLIFLASIVSVLNTFMRKHYADKYSSALSFIGMILLGIFFSFFIVNLYAALIAWTGKWLKGRAGTVAITRVLAYSQLPSITLLIIQIPCVLLFGMELFSSNPYLYNSETIGQVVTMSWMILSVIMSIWSFILGIIGLAELQNFSLWNSFLNYMIPILIIILVISIPIAVYFFSLFN